MCGCVRSTLDLVSVSLFSRIRRSALFRYRTVLWNLLGLFRRHATVCTEQGKYILKLGREEFIGKSLYCAGQFELQGITRSLEHLRSIGRIPRRGEGTVLDVGANNGVTSVSMIVLGEVARSVALEPEPENFALLQRNVALNGIQDRVKCFQYAASAENGTLEFELSGTSYGDHRVRSAAPDSSSELYGEPRRPVIQVQGKRLDDVVREANEEISFIWIDIQGYEGYAFKGGEKLLRSGIPVVAEFWPYGIDRSGMTRQQFCELAAQYWDEYYVLRDERFIRSPIDDLPNLFDQVGYGHTYDNMILA